MTRKEYREYKEYYNSKHETALILDPSRMDMENRKRVLNIFAEALRAYMHHRDDMPHLMLINGNVYYLESMQPMFKPYALCFKLRHDYRCLAHIGYENVKRIKFI